MYRLTLSLLCILLSCNIYARQHVYAGLDIMSQQANLQSGYGGDLFSTQQRPQFDIFVGYYVCALLGVEFAYAQSLTSSGVVFVPAATSQFGVATFTGIASNVYAHKKKYNSLSIDYVPSISLPIFNLIPVVGIAYSKANAELNLLQFDGSPATNLQQNNYALHFAIGKWVPRMGLRIQYGLYKFAVRAGFIWQQNSLLKANTTRQINPNQILTAKFANSYSLGCGILYKF